MTTATTKPTFEEETDDKTEPGKIITWVKDSWAWVVNLTSGIIKWVFAIMGIIIGIIVAFGIIVGYNSDSNPIVIDNTWVHQNCVVTETKQFWFFGDTQFVFKADNLTGFLDVDDCIIKLESINGNEKNRIQSYGVEIIADDKEGKIRFKNKLMYGHVSTKSNTMELNMNGSIIGNK